MTEHDPADVELVAKALHPDDYMVWNLGERAKTLRPEVFRGVDAVLDALNIKSRIEAARREERERVIHRLCEKAGAESPSLAVVLWESESPNPSTLTDWIKAQAQEAPDDR